MITPETRVQIRRYFYAEHWKIGTIAQALDVHPDTVRRAIEVERFQHAEPLRPSVVDPYLPFVRQVLEQHPRLRATRLYQMIRDRGYSGSVEQLRRVVARLRPQPHEAFLRLQVFPAEQAQVDWAYFGSVMVGRAKRQLSCFVTFHRGGVPQDMRGYALLSQGSAVFPRLGHVTREQVLNAISAQGSTSCTGEQRFGISSPLLPNPRAEDRDRGFGQRGTAFLSTFAPAVYMCASAQRDIVVPQRGHLGQAAGRSARR